MERVVEKLEVVRPRIFWKIVQPVNKTSEVSVSEKTESSRNFDRVIEPLGCDIWLTNQSNTRHRAALELSFHGGECDRLMIANHLGLLVTRRKSNKQRCDQANE